MNIQVTWHHADRSSTIEDLLHHKLEKLERHQDNINTVHVSLEHHKQEFTIKMTVHAYNKDIHAHDTNADMYKAIDEVTHKFIRQVEEQKEKAQGR